MTRRKEEKEDKERKEKEEKEDKGEGLEGGREGVGERERDREIKPDKAL